MGHINIPNSSVVYDNPRQIDQSTNLDPTTAAPWSTGNQPYTVTVPPSPPATFGVAGRVISPGTQVLAYALGSPQPGTFDASPPVANPVLFNKQPAPLSAGGIQIPNSSCVVKNPA
jgi:hypothetical protein